MVKSEETIAIEVERKLRELVDEAGDDGPEAYLVRINPRVTRAGSPATARAMLHALEAETGRCFHFEGSEGLPLDHFAVTHGGLARGGRASAPCRSAAGDEVHVDIVEPHMYDVDDAVAKIDGYIISVANGGRRSWARSSSCGSRRRAARPRPRC